MRLRRTQTIFSALVIVGLMASCGGSEPMVLSIQTAGGERAANDAMMADVDITYDLADDVTASETSAHAYRVVAPDNTKTTVTTLATALGLSGQVQQDDSGTFSLGVDEKRGSGLWAYTTFGPPSWSYFSGAASGSSRAVTAPCDPAQQECPPDTPVADETPTTSSTVPLSLISEDDARQRATDVVTALGYSMSDIVLDSSTDEWGTHVTARLLVDGRDASTMAFFDYGDKGALITASGFLGSFERADKYQLIGLADAVKRLSTPLFSGGLVARDTTAGTPNPVTTTGESATDTVPGSPGPDVSVAPKTVIVPITTVEVVLSLAWLGDQSSMLVPSYRFSNSDGEVGTVYAIEDKYVRQAPLGEGQAPVDEGQGSGSSGEPSPDMTPIAQDLANTLVGLTEDDAMKVAAERGWIYRLVERDGEMFAVTADYVTNRVNVVVTKGKVTKVSVG